MSDKFYFGVSSVTVAIFALAQRLGNYENKRVALGLAVVAGCLFIVFIGMSVRDIQRWRAKRKQRPNMVPMPQNTPKTEAPTAAIKLFNVLDVHRAPYDPKATYKWKLRVVLGNNTRQTLD